MLDNENESMSVKLKMEAYQPTGSFKLRGMEYLCRQAIRDGATHLVSSSGGNAGLSVAYAGRKLGVKTTVVVPKTTPAFIVEKLEREGAHAIVYGDVWNEAHEYALALVKGENTVYVPPFDHALLWAGHSTMVDELKEQCDEQPDLIILSVGGGGLLCGIVEGLIRNNWTSTRIMAVETIGAASLSSAIKAGRLVSIDRIDTIATSLGALKVSSRALEYAQMYDIVPYLVTDASAARACVRFADKYRTLVEPACGASLSVVYDQPEMIMDYKNIVVIVCGGAIVNLEKLAQWQLKK